MSWMAENQKYLWFMGGCGVFVAVVQVWNFIRHTIQMHEKARREAQMKRMREQAFSKERT